MITFIVQVLAPAWFHAIAQPSFVDIPRSLHKLVTLMAEFGRENFDGDVAPEEIRQGERQEKRQEKSQEKQQGRR